MNYTYYNLTTRELEEEANKVREIIIDHLYKNGHITAEVYKDMKLNHGIIIRKPSFFSKLWKTKKVKDVTQYMIVKQITMVESNEKEPKSVLNVVKFDNGKESEKE
jgi:hypothetical protein